MSVHLPVGLLCLAIAIFMASQIGASNRAKATMNWQLDNLEKQSAQLKEAKAKFATQSASATTSSKKWTACNSNIPPC